jgi:hypothetical protein
MAMGVAIDSANVTSEFAPVSKGDCCADASIGTAMSTLIATSLTVALSIVIAPATTGW